jgi:hypothetical protein
MRQIKDGKVPSELYSKVEVDGWTPDTYFDFNVRGNTCRSPLWRMCKILEEDLVFRGKEAFKGENDLVRGQVTGDWLSDLKGVSLDGMDWVSSHGVTFHPVFAFERMKHEDAESVATTHYLYRNFFQIHNRQLMISELCLTRTTENGQGTVEKILVDKMACEEGVSVLVEEGELPMKENNILFNVESRYLVVGKKESIRRIVNNQISVKIDPQVDAAGFYLLSKVQRRIKIHVHVPNSLHVAKFTSAGLVHVIRDCYEIILTGNK